MLSKDAMPPTAFMELEHGTKLGYKIYSREKRGVPLLLVNGMSAVMEDWQRLVDALSKSRPVVIYDHRGIGASTLSEKGEDMSIDMLARDALALVRHLALAEVHLLGFSMGGMVVQAILTQPDAKVTPDGAGIVTGGITIRRAVLTATCMRLPQGDFEAEELCVRTDHLLLTHRMRLYELPRVERQKAVTEYFMRMQYFDEALVPGSPVLDLFKERVALAPHTRRPQPIIMAQSHAIASFELGPRMESVPLALPILLIHGRRDRMVSYDESILVQQGLPQAVRYFPRPESAPSGTAEFSHLWYDFFDVDRDWAAPIARFLDHGTPKL